MGNRAHRNKELNFTIQELYEELQSARKVGEIVGLDPSCVARRLAKAGLTKGRGQVRWSCVEPECDKRTEGKLRCPFHDRVAHAQRSQRYRDRLKKRLTNLIIDGIQLSTFDQVDSPVSASAVERNQRP